MNFMDFQEKIDVFIIKLSGCLANKIVLPAGNVLLVAENANVYRLIEFLM